MKNKVEKIKKEIKAQINYAYFLFKRDGEEDPVQRAKIKGMIKVLEMITGNEYSYNEKGLIKLNLDLD